MLGSKAFQYQVVELTEGDIKFTLEIWEPDGTGRVIEDGIKVIGGKSLPYLDAELKFNSNDELTFGVHFKHDFEHKYVGRESMHTKSCLNAIPGSVAIRLGGLTTITPENENKHLCKIYPEVRKAMIEARLLKDNENYLN